MTNKNPIVFSGKNIRRIWHDKGWFFSVVDIIEILTESKNPRNYWNMLKIREKESSGIELYTICVRLKLTASDGKMRETDCANKESVFRIIQSIPSKKAEPFKRWLAKVGSERVDEIENPELAQTRMKSLYEKKGYSKNWIDKRLRGIAIRQNLTDEWKNRGVEENVEYAILTNEISKATFGKTIKEYKELKNLNQENLRDHLDELELIFSMLGEKVTTEITLNKNVQGFKECETAAQQGGEVAGNARKEAELKIGKSVVSKENYLQDNEKNKKQKNNILVEVGK
ncbi:Bro-N domain-containing protein [archaeon]|jgi:DNA-damage-inducible protein D|nr:Bro-N domain-containing protein [archaeon]MBT4373590.1 Bro-N domain-containing protein [archaeon]MBT4532038.1 Bro-N domain-containing protein [archaeon]MBT7001705.1 Bro-N domain-containing protein [archaeon]MBT7282403.1 Bro-N domain-containing protein [archaeon]